MNFFEKKNKKSDLNKKIWFFIYLNDDFSNLPAQKQTNKQIHLKHYFL